MKPTEIILEVTEASEGGYDAKALGFSIFTQGENWADLKAQVKDATRVVEIHIDADRERTLLTKGSESGRKASVP